MSTEKIFAMFFAFIAVVVIGGCSLDSQRTNTQTQQPSREASAQERGLISAAYQGNVRQMKAMLDAGADVNAFDDRLGSPLPAASYSGSVEAVRMLIDRGADLNRKDNEGMTPLMNATLSGNADVVRLLLSKGADVNIISSGVVDGREARATALMLAKGSRHNEIITLLVQAGAKE